MKSYSFERAAELGRYIIETGATVRQTAAVFKVSKSTVHKDVTDRLKVYKPELYKQVAKVLKKNKDERHIRGGIATREKYLLNKKP
jgi:putative DeoR family transcriptional regulator (stage III sporulation protein D)